MTLVAPGVDIPALNSDTGITEPYAPSTLNLLIAGRLHEQSLGLEHRLVTEEDLPATFCGRQVYTAVNNYENGTSHWVCSVTNLLPIDEIDPSLSLSQVLPILKNDIDRKLVDAGRWEKNIVINIPLAHRVESFADLLKKWLGISGHYTHLRLTWTDGQWTAKLYDSHQSSWLVRLVNALFYRQRQQIGKMLTKDIPGIVYQGIEYLGVQNKNKLSCGYWVDAMIKTDIEKGEISAQKLFPINQVENSEIVRRARERYVVGVDAFFEIGEEPSEWDGDDGFDVLDNVPPSGEIADDTEAAMPSGSPSSGSGYAHQIQAVSSYVRINPEDSDDEDFSSSPPSPNSAGGAPGFFDKSGVRQQKKDPLTLPSGQQSITSLSAQNDDPGTPRSSTGL
jgi:hypothetical protein